MLKSQEGIPEQSIEESIVVSNRVVVDSKPIIAHSSIPDLESFRSKKQFNSPKSMQKTYRELTAEKSGLRHNSVGKEYGELHGASNTTARRRRIMMLEDAACSSVNF